MTSHPHIHTKVTGDGHRGIGHSGVGSSAIGYRESASGSVGTASRHSCIDFAAGRTMVGARFIVHSFAEGAAKPRPYPRDRIRFGWRVAASGGGWRVDTISGLRSRPSGAWFGHSGSGAGPGTDTRKIGVIKSSKGDWKPEDWLRSYFQVTGDGHRGISHSGVGSSAISHRLSAIGYRYRLSAIGYRYREPADEILPSPPAVSNGRDAVAPLPIGWGPIFR